MNKYYVTIPPDLYSVTLVHNSMYDAATQGLRNYINKQESNNFVLPYYIFVSEKGFETGQIRLDTSLVFQNMIQQNLRSNKDENGIY